jgi:8-oxo-dGTP diphosphatase
MPTFKEFKDYPKPAVTVDMVIFTIKNNNLQVLLIKRGVEPSKGLWALPGGFVKLEESLDDAAKRELEEETGVKDVYLEQLYTFGDPKRDSRGRVITVSYMALVNHEKIRLSASTDSADVNFFSLDKMQDVAFDHRKIIEYGLKRLRWKFEYTPVAFSLLADKFTLGELQKTYEIIFDKKFDKRNFRKKILSLGILNEHGIMEDVPNRPPKLYSLKKKIPQVLEIIKI